MYNFLINVFDDGETVFDAEAADVRVEAPATVGGPDVETHIVTNDAGAIIDLDGTGPATIIPPKVTFKFRFIAATPSAHSQYNNLMAMKGHHGTIIGKLHGPGISEDWVTAPARLIEVDGNARGLNMHGKQSVLVVTATWQLKDFPEWST